MTSPDRGMVRKAAAKTRFSKLNVTFGVPAFISRAVTEGNVADLKTSRRDPGRHSEASMRELSTSRTSEKPIAICSHADDYGVNAVLEIVCRRSLEKLTSVQRESYERLDAHLREFRAAGFGGQSREALALAGQSVPLVSRHLALFGVAVEEKEGLLFIVPQRGAGTALFNRFAFGLDANLAGLSLSFDPYGLLQRRSAAFYDDTQHRIGLSTLPVLRPHVLKDELALGLGHEPRHAITQVRLAQRRPSLFYGKLHRKNLKTVENRAYGEGFNLDELFTHHCDIVTLIRQRRSTVRLKDSELEEIMNLAILGGADRLSFLSSALLSAIPKEEGSLHAAFLNGKDRLGRDLPTARVTAFDGSVASGLEIPLIGSRGLDDGRNGALLSAQLQRLTRASELYLKQSQAWWSGDFSSVG